MLQNEKEKNVLMGNLSALKGIVDYKGISITEDLTLEQRKEFRTLSMEEKTTTKKTILNMN